jgi:hypothetical protein
MNHMNREMYIPIILFALIAIPAIGQTADTALDSLNQHIPLDSAVKSNTDVFDSLLGAPVFGGSDTVHTDSARDSAYAGPAADTALDLSFDFGITRVNDFNFWPIVRYYKSLDKNELRLDIAASLFRHEYNRSFAGTHDHFFPFYWMSGIGKDYDARFFSLYYPSLVRYGTGRDNSLFYFSFLELAQYISAMSFMKSKDGLFTRNNLFFLLWSKNDRALMESYLVFFPLLWMFENKAGSSCTVFPLYSSGTYNDKKEEFKAITPLYWHFSSPSGSRRTLFPLWWDRETFFNNDTARSRLVLPVYWHDQDRDQNYRVLFPLFWYLRDEDYFSQTLLPLYSFGHATDSSAGHRVISPLFWHIYENNSTSTLLAPFWYRKKSIDSLDTTTTDFFTPCYWTKQSLTENNRAVIPFFWRFNNNERQSTTLLPFFSYGSAPHDSTSHLVLSPLFWHFAQSRGYSTAFFPLLWNRRLVQEKDTSSLFLIFPLYVSLLKNSDYMRIIFPLLWVYGDEQYRSWTIPPLLSYGSSPDRHQNHLILSPLLWNINRSEYSFSTLFPVWWHKTTRQEGDTLSTSFLLPLYWSRLGTNDTSRVFLPLLWIFNSKQYHSFTFAPFYSRNRSLVSTESIEMITPLFWRSTLDFERHVTLFPLWWHSVHWNSIDTTTTDFIVPSYWSKSNASTDNHVLFPVYWRLKDRAYESTTFFPLVSWGATPTGDTHHLMLSLLYWRFIDSFSIRNRIYPFWWQSTVWHGRDTTRTNVLFPLYLSLHNFRDHVHIGFPLFWSFYSSSYHSLTLLPIFSYGATPHHDETHFMAGTLFYRFYSPNGFSNTLFPIWWQKTRYYGKDTIKSHIIFPLYWSKHDKDERYRIFFPLYWDLHNRLYSSCTLAPLFSCGTSADRSTSHTVITPLFWNFAHAKNRKQFLIPLYHYSRSYDFKYSFNILLFLYRYNRLNTWKSNDFIWPIGNMTLDEQYRYFRLSPVIWYKKSPNSGYFSVQPFFYYGRDSFSNYFNIFWKLYEHQHTYAVMKSRRVFFNALFWNRYENGDFETRFLYEAYANIMKNGSKEKAVFPFYHSASKGDGERNISVFFGVYKYIRRRHPESNRFYQEDKIFWFIRLRSNYNKIKSLSSI